MPLDIMQQYIKLQERALEISATFGLEAFKPSYLVKMPESMAYNLVGELAGPLTNKSALSISIRA